MSAHAREQNTKWKSGLLEPATSGCACAMAAVIRGGAREIVVVNRTPKTAQAVATDLR
jgi:L-lactate dehydrogenase